MTEPPKDPLTPPGPGMQPPSQPAPRWQQPAYAVPPAPPSAAPDRGGDKGLGWTGFALALVLCFPLLPLVGAVLAIVTIARRRFRPMWVAWLTLLIGLAGTALQVGVVARGDVWGEIQEAMNDSLEDEAEDARRSGEPTEISPLKLRPGDCVNDAAVKGIRGDDIVYKATVTLLPCKNLHDVEVYATLEVPGGDFPGQDAIDEVAGGCFPAFKKYVGKAYGESDYEIYYYFPTKQSWKVLGDRIVTCLAGHPKRQVRGSIEGTKR